MDEKKNTSNTPYDDVYKTLLNDCSSLIIPVVKVQNYSVEDIFEKELYFLIPFHIFIYEHNFQMYNSDKAKLTELLTVYEQIVIKLNKCVKKHKLTEYAKHTIIDMSKKILEQIAAKYSNVKKEVGDLMGGKILNYEAKDILNAGRAEGMATGRVTECIENILAVLSMLGDVSEKLRETILMEQDLTVLKGWFKTAIHSKTIEEFEEKM